MLCCHLEEQAHQIDAEAPDAVDVDPLSVHHRRHLAAPRALAQSRAPHARLSAAAAPCDTRGRYTPRRRSAQSALQAARAPPPRPLPLRPPHPAHPLCSAPSLRPHSLASSRPQPPSRAALRSPPRSPLRSTPAALPATRRRLGARVSAPPHRRNPPPRARQTLTHPHSALRSASTTPRLEPPTHTTRQSQTAHPRALERCHHSCFLPGAV
eukprot:1586171-Rhodomonas_salina.2